MKNKYITKDSVGVSIPALNEEATIKEVALEALGELKKITKDYELLLVDDGSTDKTGSIMDELAKKYPKNVRVIHHKKNMGFTGAISTSLFKSKKDIVLLGPADGQFDFALLKRFVKGINGYDAAVGYRTKNEEPWQRKVQSFFFHTACKILLGIRLKEFSTITMWRRNLLKSVDTSFSDARGCGALPEIVYKAQKLNFKFNQIPMYWKARKKGQAKGRLRLSVIYTTLAAIFNIWWKGNFSSKK